eukprot:2938513-Pyramimonas_sp.AAC.1
MAHGVHLSAAERAVLRERGAAIASCPLSNFYFADGCLDAKAVVRLSPSYAVLPPENSTFHQGWPIRWVGKT